MSVDLLGKPLDQLTLEEAQKLKKKLHRKHQEEPRGYASIPGTGPAGKTCKDCEHYAVVRYAKAYRKCALMRATWSHTARTDIKAGSPACSKFQPE